MAAVAVGLDLDIPPKVILRAMEDYTGIGRRFELKKKVKNIMIVEDYGHHPTEIRATLDAAKRGFARRLVVVFQPHRYSRLSLLMDSFATAFNQADILVITEIYPAGETPLPGITGEALYEEILRFGHRDVHFEPNLKKVPRLLKRLARPGDIILAQGAGNITKAVPEIIAALEEKR
jgi:UDP-N-acetylmuramate--alanine ligase